jgi:hypothetical protein
VEAVAQAVPTAGLTDEQKVASITQAILPTILSTAAARGVSAPTDAKISAYVTAGLLSLNAFSNLFDGAAKSPAAPAPVLVPAPAPDPAPAVLAVPGETVKVETSGLAPA